MAHTRCWTTPISDLKCSETRETQLQELEETLEEINEVYGKILHYWLETGKDNFFPRNTWYIECDKCYIDCEDVPIILEHIDPEFNFEIHDTYAMMNGCYGGTIFVIRGKHKKLPFAFNFHTDPNSVKKLITLGKSKEPKG